MSDQSGIEWTDATWNPTRGCSRVSEGCRNCYAETMAARFSGPGAPYQGLTRGGKWTGKIALAEDKLVEPLHWKKPRRIFVNSMSDLFHEGVPDEFVDRVFAVMALCPQHTFQILTKRPERMRAYFAQPQAWHESQVYQRGQELVGWSRMRSVGWPLSNVWLGVSVEDQGTADARILELLRTPAAVRFVSYEPALGPVDFKHWLYSTSTMHMALSIGGALRNKSFDGFTDDAGRPMSPAAVKAELEALQQQGAKLMPMSKECAGFSDQTGCPGHETPALDWIICGGESGPGARPCDVAWIRSAVQQCAAAGVACFVKQLGARPFDSAFKTPTRGPWDSICGANALKLRDRKGGDPTEWPKDLRVREFPQARVKA